MRSASGAKAAKEMNGLEYLRAIMRGGQPAAPLADLSRPQCESSR
jgi:hypothetical protein